MQHKAQEGELELGTSLLSTTTSAQEATLGCLIIDSQLVCATYSTLLELSAISPRQTTLTPRDSRSSAPVQARAAHSTTALDHPACPRYPRDQSAAAISRHDRLSTTASATVRRLAVAVSSSVEGEALGAHQEDAREHRTRTSAIGEDRQARGRPLVDQRRAEGQVVSLTGTWSWTGGEVDQE